MRLSVSENGEDFVEPIVVGTPKEFALGMDEFKKAYQTLTKGKQVEICAGGIRRLNPEKEAILPDFRLPDWSGKPLKSELQKITGATVLLENDTALVGLGEAVKGAGKGYPIISYFTISTGVGGVRIVNGKIEPSRFGYEPGHQIIDLDWSKFPSLKDMESEGFGQLEAYLSGTAMEKRFGKPPREITDEGIWDEMNFMVAVSLNNAIAFWSPDMIVLGGGMMGTPGISVDGVKGHLGKLVKIFPSIPEVKKALLGDFGGLHGALVFAKG